MTDQSQTLANLTALGAEMDGMTDISQMGGYHAMPIAINELLIVGRTVALLENVFKEAADFSDLPLPEKELAQKALNALERMLGLNIKQLPDGVPENVFVRHAIAVIEPIIGERRRPQTIINWIGDGIFGAVDSVGGPSKGGFAHQSPWRIPTYTFAHSLLPFFRGSQRGLKVNPASIGRRDELEDVQAILDYMVEEIIAFREHTPARIQAGLDYLQQSVGMRMREVGPVEAEVLEYVLSVIEEYRERPGDLKKPISFT